MKLSDLSQGDHGKKVRTVTVYLKLLLWMQILINVGAPARALQ